MNLQRPTSTPRFVDYAVDYALKSLEREWTDEIKSFDPNPIKIPAYQRRIVWDEETIGDFLDSKAVIFGTVILAQSPNEESLILLDGLQRFATSTAILHYLHTDILPGMSNKTDVEYFKRLAADTESKKSIFEHNDNELRNNSRRGIQESYKQLYENVMSIIDKLNEKNSEELAEKLIQTFIKKQIAIDTYHGFKNAREYTQTFININSTGIDLTPVDLLRSEIIQQAETNKWSPSDIDDIENRFTEVFQSSKIKSTRVLGKHMYDALTSDPNIIFKNWEHLNKDDVDVLLDFIDITYIVSLENDEDGNKKWPYLYENFQCGDIPFSIIVWFYYQKLQNGEKPDFLGGQLDTTDDLCVLLRAFYRRIISSSMNRADVSASKLIQGREKFDGMKDVADDVNPTDENLDESVDMYWITKNIKKASTNKLRRIFNACLLPSKNSDKDFHPLQYGAGDMWTIEYLIQKERNMDNETCEYVETLMNKIPIPSNIKKNLKNSTCIEKLVSNEMNAIKNLHPYLEWLTDTHYSKYKNAVFGDTNDYILNLPKHLSDASNSSIVNDRLDKIAGLLRDRV